MLLVCCWEFEKIFEFTLRWDCQSECQSKQDWYHNRIQVCWLSLSIPIIVCQGSHLSLLWSGGGRGDTHVMEQMERHSDNMVLRHTIVKSCQHINTISWLSWANQTSSLMIISMSWEWWCSVAELCPWGATMIVREWIMSRHVKGCRAAPEPNDLTIGWQNFNLLSHTNATIAPQARKAWASEENLNYVTLAPQARPSGEILNYLLSRYSDIL